MRTTIAFILCAAGCGSGNGGDMGVHDMRVGDLAYVDMARATTTFHYVTNAIQLPKSKNDYAVDLNGDGKPDNALGFIASTLLATQNIDLNMQENQAIMAGNGLELLSVTSGDPLLVTDSAAEVTLYVALPANPPDFTGKGKFQIDHTAAKGTLTGPIATGSFESLDPMTLTQPPTISLRIPLYTNTVVTLPVVGARVGFTPSPDMLAAGQLNGAVKETDIQNILIPALAQTFTMIAQKMPCDANCMQVQMSFDKGGCQNPDGSMAVAGDMKIDICEVAQSPLVQALLGPDVQLFDDMGNWHPNPANTNKDSLSLGVAFTGVPANFIE